jgi:putative acetyltransferase
VNTLFLALVTIERRLHTDPDFRNLCEELDNEFWVRYPHTQQNFEPYNHVDQSANVVVAYMENVAVGCGCFRPTDEEDEIEIKRMYVQPLFRGRGISKLILGALEQWAKEHGCSRSKLETGINQPEAIALYTGMGYLRIANYPPYTEVIESICMAKSFYL